MPQKKTGCAELVRGKTGRVSAILQAC